MDSSDGESLVETVDEIWTLWGDIFEISYELSADNEFNTWFKIQMRNISRLTSESTGNQNKRKFNPIQNEFCKLIYGLKRIYYDTNTKPTQSIIKEYDGHRLILKKLQLLYENDKNEKTLQQINIKIDEIWKLIEHCHNTKYGFVNKDNGIWKTNWNEAQRQNIVKFESKANKKFNKEQTLELNAFITLLKRMTTTQNQRWGDIQWPSNILQRLDELINTLAQSQRMRLQTQAGGLKSQEKADDQIESAIHRLISICEKLADQKKLAR